MNQLQRCLLPGIAELSGLNLRLDQLPESTSSWKRLGTMSVTIKRSPEVENGVPLRLEETEITWSTETHSQCELQSTDGDDSVRANMMRTVKRPHQVWLTGRSHKLRNHVGQSARRAGHKHRVLDLVGMDEDSSCATMAKNTGPPGLHEKIYRVRGGPPPLDKASHLAANRALDDPQLLLRGGREPNDSVDVLMRYERSPLTEQSRHDVTMVRREIDSQFDYDWWDGYGPPKRTKYRPPPNRLTSYGRHHPANWGRPPGRHKLVPSMTKNRWVMRRHTGELYLTDEAQQARQACGFSREGPPKMEAYYAG